MAGFLQEKIYINILYFIQGVLFMIFQRTIAQTTSISGIGLHSGHRINLTLRPAEAGTVITSYSIHYTKLYDSPDFMAYQKASLALLRLIALVAYDKLPASIQPEGLERATFFALENLPTGLQSALKSGDDELPLPPEACTRLHHFFRRMLQLPQRKSPGDLCLALKILMQWNFHRLGGRALPAEALHDTAEAPLLLNPDRESGLPQRVMEIAPQAILAYTSLQRILANLV